MNSDIERTEFLICLLAAMMQGSRSIATGASSPIPGAATLLAQAKSGGATTAMILGSNSHGPFNDGGPELFDRAAQGRIDVFFLGGGQIDGNGNINLVGTGPYPNSDTRFPGSYGAAYLYYLVPRIILFREEHSRRVLVPSVDFISAPGHSAESIYRTGGPYAPVTGKAVMMFDGEAKRFRLESIHPGGDLKDVLENTGFTPVIPATIPVTNPPTPEDLTLLRGEVHEQIAGIYPEFTRTRLGG